MLFNSAMFLFVFFPISLLVYFGIAWKSAVKARVALAIISFVFYAYWDWRFIPLLAGSIVINFLTGLKISNHINLERKLAAKRSLIIGLVFNLSLLVFFKYTNMLVFTFASWSHTSISIPHIILPIGISFFTFTQIAFLVDAYQKKVNEYRFWDYALFVSYFPHQIAGPILHHKEMMSQFTQQLTAKINYQNLSVGFSILTVGLAKKILLADPLSTFADPVFSNTELGFSPTFIESWGAALAYTLQLYLDFSAYCDMAIGISLMFGIKLPLNFNSPYKSLSIIEFWRRWHVTLSRFLKDYLYIPLGGNRTGNFRRYMNLLVTMALGGLWHGASWTFLFWGVLHGVYLTINHLWRDYFFKGNRTQSYFYFSSYQIICWALTFNAVLVGWVFFRSSSFSSALLMLNAMFGFEGIAIPTDIYDGLLSGWPFISSDVWSGSLGGVKAISFILIILIGVNSLPNTQQIFRNFEPCLGDVTEWKGTRNYSWSPSLPWAIFVSLLFSLSISRLGNDSTFLYFNF